MRVDRKPVNSASRIYQTPLLIAVISGVGLASALLGDGVWDILSWINLGIPVAIAIFYWRRRAT